MLSTPHKPMAHHNTIPNTTTPIHLHMYPHKKTHPLWLHYSSPFPLTTPPNWCGWCWQHDGTPQYLMKINTSPNDNTTYQHAHFHADYFGISKFLNEVCLNPISNYWLIFTPSLPMGYHKPLILTPSSHTVFPQALFFPLMYQYRCVNHRRTRTSFFPYMVSHNIRNLLVSTTIPSINSFHINTTIGKHEKFWWESYIYYLPTFFLFFKVGAGGRQ